MTLLQSYIAKPSTQKVLGRRPGEQGFSLIELVVVIAVLAILSAVAIPAFVGVQANGKASAVKNGLANGVKECAVRASDDKSTAFADAQSFASVTAFSGFSLAAHRTTKAPAGSCFGAKATATLGSGLTDFTIEMDPADGTMLKTCGNPSLPGCKPGSVW